MPITKSTPPKSTINKIPRSWKQILDKETVQRSLTRIAYEILEQDRNLSRLAIVGVRTCGEILGKRLVNIIEEIEGVKVPFGTLDITLYRDDLHESRSQPMLKGTDLPFDVTGARIILVDDVLFTGRTIRAALDAVIDFGRPAKVELAVLIDRGHRELPIRADYVGKNLPSELSEMFKVRLSEQGFEDGVYRVDKESLSRKATNDQG